MPHERDGLCPRVCPLELDNIEKRKALVHRRQAKDKSAERLLFNLLDGLAFDLEPIAPGARHRKAELLTTKTQ
ncbi:hypothetical protein CEW92_07830 [Bacillaceae bacterium SAS-127]|nr:hypothetical protein CEW92_07830 [Bacillaceae bacterium SAS-127]